VSYSFDADFVAPWVFEKAGGVWFPGSGSAIGKLKDGELIAGSVYDNWNGANINAHIAGIGNWADKHFMWMIFDYPFNQVGAKRITAPICSTNKKSIDLVERMGFNLEAKLHGATSKGDLLLYVMFKDECKYLRGRYGKTAERTATA
jgi:RimJ/RimL family protein N-acetyltransferase